MNTPTPFQPMAEPASARPTSVMVLSVWAAVDSSWHARLVGADAHVHDFNSPFELARFVADMTSLAPNAAADGDSAPGLR